MNAVTEETNAHVARATSSDFVSQALPADVILLVIGDVWIRRAELISALTRAERTLFESFTIEKRARDWLAGRLAGKRAVQRALGISFARIGIVTSHREETSGRPEPLVDGTPLEGAHLTIAHTGDLAAACFARAPIGLDLEVVAPRDDSFAKTFLTAAELAELAHLEGAARDRELTLRWCTKEAISKHDGTGLRRAFAELHLPAGAHLDRGCFSFRSSELCWAIVRTTHPESGVPWRRAL